MGNKIIAPRPQATLPELITVAALWWLLAATSAGIGVAAAIYAGARARFDLAFGSLAVGVGVFYWTHEQAHRAVAAALEAHRAARAARGSFEAATLVAWEPKRLADPNYVGRHRAQHAGSTAPPDAAVTAAVPAVTAVTAGGAS